MIFNTSMNADFDMWITDMYGTILTCDSGWALRGAVGGWWRREEIPSCMNREREAVDLGGFAMTRGRWAFCSGNHVLEASKHAPTCSCSLVWCLLTASLYLSCLFFESFNFYFLFSNCDLSVSPYLPIFPAISSILPLPPSLSANCFKSEYQATF